MAKQTIKIELNEKDLKELIAKEFGLKLDKMIIHVSHYGGDQREAGYTNIIAESERTTEP